MAVENITLNLIPTGDTPSIHVAQFDVDRPFTVTLKEGTDDFTPTDYTIELQVRKVDNNIVTVSPDQTSGNIVTFNTTEQMTACSGTNLAELQLTKNDQTFATLHFYLVVQRDVLAGGVTSDSAIHNLTEQIAEIVPGVIGDDYYNKTEVDELIAEHTFDPTNYYDKSDVNTLLSSKADTSSLATVATTGSYDDLINKPTIPAAQVNSDWNAVSGVAQILNKPSLSTVATSGSYNDLTDKPTIPTNAEQLPIESGSATNTKSYIDSINKIKVFTTSNIALSSQSWIQSAGGIYYTVISLTNDLPSGSVLVGITISGFASIRETDVLQPLINGTVDRSIAIMSNVNTFLGANSTLTLKVLYI